MAIDLEAIRKKMNQLNGQRGSNVQIWRPQKIGDYRIRALPWPTNITADGTPFVERYFYYIGENSVLSTKQFGEEDPVDDVIRSLFKTGNDADKEIAKKLLPKMRAYLPILVKGEEDKGVQVYSFNRMIYQRILSFFINEEIGDITSIEEGFDLTVSVVDSGRKWQGKSMLDQNIDAARRPTHLSKWFDDDDKMNATLAKLPNIDELYASSRKTPAELEKILNAWLAGDHEGEGETSRGSVSTDLDKLANEVNVRSSKQVDVDDEEEDEKPKARKRRVKDLDVDDTTHETKKNLDDAFDELMVD